jgi:hypothetical protein
MGITHYCFALFIFGLVCAALVLGKHLFADVRQQRKLLDERETKLLRLYQMVEEAMEEYYDQVSEAKSEIRALTAQPVGTDTVAPWPEEQGGAAPQATEPEQPPAFQHIIDGFPAEELATDESGRLLNRSEAVLSLWNQGKKKARIAEELGITTTEVLLVLGLNGNIAADRKK